METTIPGLFAAGDCTGGLLQVATAVSEGCAAGISAGKYIRRKFKNKGAIDYGNYFNITEF